MADQGPTPAELHAEQCRKELDEMDYFEGTLRRDACIRRHIEAAIEEVLASLKSELAEARAKIDDLVNEIREKDARWTT